jgi:hypothetical protein
MMVGARPITTSLAVAVDIRGHEAGRVALVQEPRVPLLPLLTNSPQLEAWVQEPSRSARQAVAGCAALLFAGACTIPVIGL